MLPAAYRTRAQASMAELALYKARAYIYMCEHPTAGRRLFANERFEDEDGVSIEVYIYIRGKQMELEE